MFEEPNNNTEKKLVYKFNSIDENGEKYFSISVFEELEDILKYIINVFIPTDKDGNSTNKICVRIETQETTEEGIEEEPNVLFHRNFSYSELMKFYNETKAVKKHYVYPEEIVLEEECLEHLNKIFKLIEIEYNAYKKLNFPPFRKEESNINTNQSLIFNKKFTVDETIDFLAEIKDANSYEFYEEKFNLNKLNVKKVDFMLSRLLDMHLTDGVIGDYSYEDIKKTLQNMNKKYKN